MLLARKHLLALLSGLAMLYLAAVTMPDSTAPGGVFAQTSPSDQDCWNTYSVPITQPHSLGELAVLSDSDIWAVGDYRDGSTSKTLTAHWDGKNWQVASSPNLDAGSNGVTSISAVSTDDIWAGGSRFSVASPTLLDTSVSLLMRWNGTQWNLVHNPGPGLISDLNALSSTDVWAAGTEHGTVGDYHPFVMRWDGVSWSDFTSGDLDSWGQVNAMAALSASDVWLVGTKIWHWDGHSWHNVSTPEPSAKFYDIYAVASNDIWVVGSGPSQSSVVMHWNGAQWTPVQSPNVGWLKGVTALSPVSVWAVSAKGDAVHWNGSTWTHLAMPISAYHINLREPIASTDNLWFVASYSNIPNNATSQAGLIIRYSRACAEQAAKSTSPLNPPMQVPGTASRYFETGNWVRGLFLDYWDAQGGLAQQGLPLTELVGEVSPLNGVMHTMQYFERAVFEYHPENKPPYNVLLSQLGTFQYKRKYPNGAPGQKPNNEPGSIFFRETGKRLGGRFLEYWQQNGGLMQQGYPISDEFTETSELNGQQYTVQYFERAVFEKHPENQRPNDVLLSQLGRFRFYQLYVNVPTPAPMHSPTPGSNATPTATPTTLPSTPRLIASDTNITVAGGNHLFWVNVQSTSRSIYGYDLETDSHFSVTDRQGYKELATDGKTLVWLERISRLGFNSMYKYDVATGFSDPIIDVMPGEYEFYWPVLGGSTLYYSDSVQEHRGLFARNLDTGEERKIAESGVSLAAAEGVVAWRDVDDTGKVHIYRTEGRRSELAAVSAMSGIGLTRDKLVAVAPTGNILVHDLIGGAIQEISATGATSPRIKGNVVAWAEVSQIKAHNLDTGATWTVVDGAKPGTLWLLAVMEQNWLAYTEGNSVYATQLSHPR